MTAGRTTNTGSLEWCAPPEILEAVHAAFGQQIGLDPCWNPHSLVNAEKRYMLPDHDGLQEPWDASTIFVNPSYGRDPTRKTTIKNWFTKIAEAHQAGAEIIILVPVATNTSHWKQYVFGKAASICFLAAPTVAVLAKR